MLNGSSPDDSYSQLPYEKGFQFLTYLETLIGEDSFQNFIRTYIKKYSLQSVTYLDLKATWEDYVNANFKDTAQQILAAVDWDAWVKTPGANPSVYNVSFVTTDAQKFEALADSYISLAGTASPQDYQDYLNTKDPQLKVIFLNRLTARMEEFEAKLIQKLDSDLNITNDMNPEIGQRWFPLAIAFDY